MSVRRSSFLAAVGVLVALAAVTPAPSAARAQETPTIASVELTPATATVGDRLSLVITIDHAEGTTIAGPGFGADVGFLEILDIAEPRTDESRTTLEYTLTSFVIGAIEVPPLDITYRSPEGDGTLTTPAQRIDIRSVLAPGDDALRPLKPQLDIASAAPSPIVPALFVAIFATLTVFAYVLVARAIDARPAAAVHVPLPIAPHDAARTQLDALAASDVATSDPAAYYATMAAIVRQYLSARFGFAAYAMTRRELERDMAGAGIDRWPARVTANLLEQCDAVEFAAFRPPPARVDADLTAAYEIVELTAAVVDPRRIGTEHAEAGS